MTTTAKTTTTEVLTLTLTGRDVQDLFASQGVTVPLDRLRIAVQPMCLHDPFMDGRYAFEMYDDDKIHFSVTLTREG